MAQFEDIRNRHRELAQEIMPEMVAHVDWPAQRLMEYRVKALRELIPLSKAKSRWHNERQRHINTEAFREEDLESIPSMTKAELMDNFDEILTDPRLTLDRREAHLKSGDTYLNEEFVVLASSGSSGVRAVSVFSWEEAARNFVAARRLTLRWASRTGAFKKLPVSSSVGVAPGPHGTQLLSRNFGGGEDNTISVSDPIQEIIAKRNRSQPDLLHVYPSIIPRLVAAFEEGHLQIRPKVILAGAEPLLPEHQDAVFRAWGCPVFSSWGATEGASSGFDSGLLLYDDHVIIKNGELNDDN